MELLNWNIFNLGERNRMQSREYLWAFSTLSPLITTIGHGKHSTTSWGGSEWGKVAIQVCNAQFPNKKAGQLLSLPLKSEFIPNAKHLGHIAIRERLHERNNSRFLFSAQP